VTLALATALLAAAAPSHAGGLDLRIGAFFPQAHSNLFDDAATLFFVDPKKDFRGLTGGIEYSTVLTDNVELGLSLDGFDRMHDSSYRDYTHPDGGEIRQTLKVSIVPLGATIRFVPTGRRVAVAPYLGLGADLFYWRWREYGEFVDFGDPANPIVADSFRSDGWKAGFHVTGGLRFRVTHDFAVVAEGRYQRAKARRFRSQRAWVGERDRPLGLERHRRRPRPVLKAPLRRADRARSRLDVCTACCRGSRGS
jgi:opacity protein-like surface antigen